jgi:hypothetical protein
MDLTFVALIGLLIITALLQNIALQLIIIPTVGIGYLLAMAWNITGSHSPDYMTSLKMILLSYVNLVSPYDPERDPIKVEGQRIDVGDNTPAGHTYRGRYGDVAVISYGQDTTLCHVEGDLLRIDPQVTH